MHVLGIHVHIYAVDGYVIHVCWVKIVPIVASH